MNGYTLEDMQYFKELRTILSKLQLTRHNHNFLRQKNHITYPEFDPNFLVTDYKYLINLNKLVDNLAEDHNLTEESFNAILNYITLIFRIHQITLAKFHTNLEDTNEIEADDSILFDKKLLIASGILNDNVISEINDLELSLKRSLGKSTEEFSKLLDQLFSILKLQKEQEFEDTLYFLLNDYTMYLHKIEFAKKNKTT